MRYVIAGLATAVVLVSVLRGSRRGSSITDGDEPNPGLDGLPGNPEWESSRHTHDRSGALAEIEAERE